MMKLLFREATIHDIPQLAVQHRKMFDDILERVGQKLDTNKSIEIEKSQTKKLAKEIPMGSCKAWVFCNENEIIASGAISIISLVAVPNDTNSEVAYLHSMYTEMNFRGRNLAKKIIEAAITYCKEKGINRIILNSSDTGKPLYEKMGFSSVPESMRFFLNR